MACFVYSQCIVAVVTGLLYCVVGDRENQVIEIFHITSDIRYRFATTEMVSVIRNVDKVAQDISFEAALPEEAFIVSFSMTIDGKVYDGEIKKRETAQEEYKVAMDSGQSAGFIEQAPRDSNVFVVSVNVAAGSTVSFSLTYQELLQRKHGVYEQQIRVNHRKPIDDFLIEIFIQDKNKVTFVKPFALHSDSLLSNEIEVKNDWISLSRPSPETAHVAYKPNQEQQADNGMSPKFVVQYDVEHSSNGDIVVVDGYFIHFFAADVPLIPKDIVFVLDVSGSMKDNKINQLKNAMKIILNDLQKEDRFNILFFSSEIWWWKDELVMVESETIKMALEYVESLNVAGATDINKAFLEAINDLNKHSRSDHIGMIFFLTDGQATKGETDQIKIAENILKHKEIQLVIFGLAFGNNADYDFLKKISIQNSGFARKIYEGSDAALQVAGLYHQISNVSMLNVAINYLPKSVDEFTITENKFPIIFKGSEIVVSGKLADDAKKFKAEVNGTQHSGKVFIILETNDFSNFIASSPFFNSSRDFSSIVEKMWAYLTIKQLEEEKKSYTLEQDRLIEIDKRIIQMSLKVF
ncbi:Inter-alpha-trypsin inhibitor heavy chain H3 [Bulinus truncatus]|nr:Inter-alpha-trypsin inhibitor heavy chain H3 [Bulinus truncatus]